MLQKQVVQGVVKTLLLVSLGESAPPHLHSPCALFPSICLNPCRDLHKDAAVTIFSADVVSVGSYSVVT